MLGVRDDLARLLHVGGVLHEAERHHVDAERQAEREIVDVLQRDRRGRQLDARRVDALVPPSTPPSTTVVTISVPSVDFDAQLDRAVRQQQVDRRGARRARGRRTSSRCARPCRESRRWRCAARRPAVSMNRTAAFDRAGADLRSAEILQNRDLAFGALRGRADACERRRVRLVRAVRKIEADDVGAGGNERVEHGVGVRRRTDRRDDLGLTHVESISLWARLFPTPSSATSPD